jgi:hypothetical protein
MKSRRRIFIRRKTSPMRALGMLTLIFAGSFAAAAITFDWSDGPLAATTPTQAHIALPGASGWIDRTSGLRLAASSANPATHEHR